MITSEFQFRELGKAQAMGELPGVFKLVADKATGRLLGAHIAGAHATDLIAECALALQMGATAADIARAAADAKKGAVCDAATVHPHNAADIGGNPAADAAGDEGAVCNAAAIVRAHDAADIDAPLAAADAAGNFEIFHGASTTKTSKKAEISRRWVGIEAGIGAVMVGFVRFQLLFCCLRGWDGWVWLRR